MMQLKEILISLILLFFKPRVVSIFVDWIFCLNINLPEAMMEPKPCWGYNYSSIYVGHWGMLAEVKMKETWIPENLQ